MFKSIVGTLRFFRSVTIFFSFEIGFGSFLQSLFIKFHILSTYCFLASLRWWFWILCQEICRLLPRSLEIGYGTLLFSLMVSRLPDSWSRKPCIGALLCICRSQHLFWFRQGKLFSCCASRWWDCLWYCSWAGLKPSLMAAARSTVRWVPQLAGLVPGA